MTETTGDLNRRTVIKAGAWAAPAVALVVSAPALAASVERPVITPDDGTVITEWRGDHYYGSDENDADQRSYDFPVTVTDESGAPIEGTTVTVTAVGSNDDGDILSVYAFPAPDASPNDDPNPSASAVTDANGVADFAVNTQNLASDERPVDVTLTIVARTPSGATTTSVVIVRLTETD